MIRPAVRSLVAVSLTFLFANVAAAKGPAAAAERTVYMAGGLKREELVTLAAAIAAATPDSVLLISTPKADKPNQGFLDAFRPEKILRVGTFAEGVPNAPRQAPNAVEPVVEWKRGPPPALLKELFPRAEMVVVAPPQPYRLLLQSACLAGVLKAPLLIAPGDRDEEEAITRQLADWQTRQVVLVGDDAQKLPTRLERLALADENAVQAAIIRELSRTGPIRDLVIANPADKNGLSALAPSVAARRRGVLILTNEAGDDSEDRAQALLRRHSALHPDAILLLAGLKDIPMKRRPNPVEGKDAEIEMEPFTPDGSEPFSFAVGRLHHTDPAMIALILARPRLLGQSGGPRKALIASNPGGSLPLLELFSRQTSQELSNRGYDTTALFHKDVDKEKVRRLLPKNDIFLWEGHYKTLMEDYGFARWDEPLPPQLVFLQSCLALNEAEAQPLFERGAVAVVGSSTRTYSATGGAFSLAFFDALAYDDQSVGGALREAKNFLTTYAQLKEKRLGKRAKLAGANRRSSWAFTLWGDPRLKLPQPQAPAQQRPPARCVVEGNTVTMHLPETLQPTVTVEQYRARAWPNARLAGLLRPGKDEDDESELTPLVFSEVRFTKIPHGREPHLRSKVPASRWTFRWDAARGVGYLIVLPRSSDSSDLQFHVSWRE